MSRTMPWWAAALVAAVVSMAGSNRCLGDEASPAGRKIDKEKIAQIEKMVAAARARVGEKNIEEALHNPTQLGFRETPLQDVVEYLKDAHGIEIQIDESALKAADLDKDSPVTCDLKFVSLRSALNLMLAELKLTYTVQDEVLLITTVDAEKARLFTRVYLLADLAASGAPPEQRSARSWELARLIATTIAPERWRSGSGSIVAVSVGNADVLVVLQGYHVHRQVAELLEELHRLAKGK